MKKKEVASRTAQKDPTGNRRVQNRVDGGGHWVTAESRSPWLDEHDACAIVASVRKTGEATHGNLKRTLDALSKMGHRSGDVNGEGDGCGVLTDIPRRLWSEALEVEGKPAWLAEDRRFFVGHLMIPARLEDQRPVLQLQVLELVRKAGATLLIERPALTRPLALGRMARAQVPFFWQIAGLVQGCSLENVEHRLFDLTLAIERQTGIHVASLSSDSVVYKVRGSIETLYQYYPELRSSDFMTAITLGHARFSTNTATAFERVQPFSLLGHNGEINTIARLREQAQMLGVQLVSQGSDSQDLDRTLAGLIHAYGFSLGEAMELLFPPILDEVKKLSPELQEVYRYYRQAFGPFAQGPAAIISRYQDDCVFSVDALGLRPMWYGETEKEYYFSSEKGVFHLDTLLSDPRPLSPGEKMSVQLQRGKGVRVCNALDLQQHMLGGYRARFGKLDPMNCFTASERGISQSFQVGSNGSHGKTTPGGEKNGRESEQQLLEQTDRQSTAFKLEHERLLAACGWSREDRDWVQELAESGHEPIASIGFDGPLAALSAERQNIADYFKEAVAVVTNPAIDRERETEHFSIQTIVGQRPGLLPSGMPSGFSFVLDSPILLDLKSCEASFLNLSQNELTDLQHELRLDDLLHKVLEEQIVRLQTSMQPGESVSACLQRLASEAVAAARQGASLILLDDQGAFEEGRGWVDPHLLVAVIDRALQDVFMEGFASTAPLPLPLDSSGKIDLSRAIGGPALSLRRQVGLILRSGAIRNLHDLAMAFGLGADAVAPYLLFETALGEASPGSPDGLNLLQNTLQALNVGLEKVISTMGIHELRGYGRLFASIGLSQPLAGQMGTTNYGGTLETGLNWVDLEREARQRAAIYRGESRPQLARVNHIYPKVWKAAGQVGLGDRQSDDFEAHAEAQVHKLPVALRHVLDFRPPVAGTPPVSPEQVDAGLTGHALPFVIASMSFGSQGETAFRAYAQAAYWLNMIALNGEGGEIKDMMGKYPHNRGQQIASGRFGVSAELVNSSNLLEIKIGQGAKPGEGGHLPGRKVSAKVAAARNAQPGVDLISPSNNHDIYSIEDLAQFIEELKTANPKARVAVKVPVVPGIGVIAVGIAKAGADIINMSGYDGGTGAARVHSLRNVGLPAEIGVVEAHRALVEAGLRHRVELWCDGGMRSAADVVKMICLGANRVGFGTLAMVAIGCTICRACQTGTCHVGITTQIESKEKADLLGLKRFEPREAEQAVDGLLKVFSGLGDGVRKITASLGFERTQDLVGRSDLLVQSAFQERLDLSELLLPATECLAARVKANPELPRQGSIPLRRPRNHLTTVISNMVMETLVAGEEQVSFEDDKVTPVDRALGTHLTGALTRYQHNWMWPPGHGGVGGDQESWRLPVNGSNGNGHHVREAALRFYASSVPGNGLGAYNVAPLSIVVEGGAQDGVAKGMQGGQVIILKGSNHDGVLIDGSVGKSLAYGATGGLVIVQGDADSRACVRLSGADVIIGGEISQPLNDHLGSIGMRANVKGFLCEYMTSGRVLVLGDPGPWICSGMTGGILYLRLQPQLNFNLDAIRRRIARGANVTLEPVDNIDEANLLYLLHTYAEELAHSHQHTSARSISNLIPEWRESFVKIEPQKRQLDQSVSTE